LFCPLKLGEAAVKPQENFHQIKRVQAITSVKNFYKNKKEQKMVFA
jgi:hypothetical protein